METESRTICFQDALLSVSDNLKGFPGSVCYQRENNHFSQKEFTWRLVDGKKILSFLHCQSSGQLRPSFTTLLSEVSLALLLEGFSFFNILSNDGVTSFRFQDLSSIPTGRELQNKMRRKTTTLKLRVAMYS